MSTSFPQPGQPLGWYKRYLPHRDEPGLIQAITYRLADSLPNDAIVQLGQELQTLPPEQAKTECRKRLDEWLDASHGCCILRQPEAANLVVETWKRFAGDRYDLIAWVVMPNHVHVLIRPYPGMALGKIVQSWKSYTARRINTMPRAGARGSHLWMREYWDRYIRDERHLAAAVDYVHENPVKAGLAHKAMDWPWSSAADRCSEPL